LADLDGDGHDDVISGSYWPGDLTLFRGEGEGRYAKGLILPDHEGKPLNAGPPWQNKNKPEMDSLAASPWLVDHDGDGDLDLLVGNIVGRVILLENAGDRAHYSFVRRGAVQADGQDLRVDGDAGPTTADWDGDGRWDLLVGGGNGAVRWFRNEGTAKAPQFAAGVALVAPLENHSLADGAALDRSRARAKVHVADWNGDGLADLLVGDYASVQLPEPELTAEGVARRDELRQQLQKLSEELSPYYQKQADDQLGDADKEKMAELRERLSKVAKELRPLQAGHRSTGFVWVYPRLPAPVGGAAR
jgi:hypothetical protein